MVFFIQLNQHQLYVNLFHDSYKKEKKYRITSKQIIHNKLINFADSIKHISFALIGKMKMVRMRARV